MQARTTLPANNNNNYYSGNSDTVSANASTITYSNPHSIPPPLRGSASAMGVSGAIDVARVAELVRQLAESNQRSRTLARTVSEREAELARLRAEKERSEAAAAATVAPPPAAAPLAEAACSASAPPPSPSQQLPSSVIVMRYDDNSNNNGCNSSSGGGGGGALQLSSPPRQEKKPKRRGDNDRSVSSSSSSSSPSSASAEAPKPSRSRKDAGRHRAPEDACRGSKREKETAEQRSRRKRREKQRAVAAAAAASREWRDRYQALRQLYERDMQRRDAELLDIQSLVDSIALEQDYGRLRHEHSQLLRQLHPQSAPVNSPNCSLNEGGLPRQEQKQQQQQQLRPASAAKMNDTSVNDSAGGNGVQTSAVPPNAGGEASKDEASAWRECCLKLLEEQLKLRGTAAAEREHAQAKPGEAKTTNEHDTTDDASPAKRDRRKKKEGGHKHKKRHVSKEGRRKRSRRRGQSPSSSSSSSCDSDAHTGGGSDGRSRRSSSSSSDDEDDGTLTYPTGERKRKRGRGSLPHKKGPKDHQRHKSSGAGHYTHMQAHPLTPPLVDSPSYQRELIPSMRVAPRYVVAHSLPHGALVDPVTLLAEPPAPLPADTRNANIHHHHHNISGGSTTTPPPQQQQQQEEACPPPCIHQHYHDPHPHNSVEDSGRPCEQPKAPVQFPSDSYNAKSHCSGHGTNPLLYGTNLSNTSGASGVLAPHSSPPNMGNQHYYPPTGDAAPMASGYFSLPPPPVLPVRGAAGHAAVVEERDRTELRAAMERDIRKHDQLLAAIGKLQAAAAAKAIRVPQDNNSQSRSSLTKSGASALVD